MGQERVWDREQERLRKQAYRERKRLEQGQLSPSQQPARADELIRPGIPTEEEYLRRELAITRAQIAQGRIKTRDANGHDLEPLRRSEQYLRWRYRGFRAGQIASL